MKKKVEKKKLSLHKETLADLKKVAGGGALYGQDAATSAGDMICWFSDCNPCD